MEAFDIEKNMWKTINYISDNFKLRIINGGATQVTGKKIMIFGGMIEHEEGEDERDTLVDHGEVLRLSDQSFYLDVTKGSIKRGPNLKTPSYYTNNGGNLLAISNKLYAQGFGINYDLNPSHQAALSNSLSGLAAASAQEHQQKPPKAEGYRDAQSTYHHKKILHCYNLTDQEFTEIHEGIFSASGGSNRKQSLDNLDD